MLYKIFIFIKKLPLIFRIAIFFTIFFSSSYAGKFVSPEKSGFTDFWLSDGILLAVLLLADPSERLSVVLSALAASLLFELAFGNSIFLGLCLITSNISCTVAGSLLIGKHVGKKITFSGLKETSYYIFFSCIISTVLNASICSVILIPSGIKFASTWLSIWIGNSTGIMIFSPLIISMSFDTSIEKIRPFVSYLEFSAFISIIAVSAFLVFKFSSFSMKYIVLPILIVMIFRFGLKGISSANAVFAIIYLTMTSVTSAVPDMHKNPDITADQLFVCLNLITSLMLFSILSERKINRNKLIGSENKYKFLADGINDIFFAFDGNLKFTYWNKAAENTFGFDSDHVLGRYCDDIFQGSNTRNIEDYFRESLNSHVPISDFFEYGIKDVLHYFEVSVHPYEDGVSVFVKDRTEKKITEAKLNESEHLFKSLFRSMVEGVAIHELVFDGNGIPSDYRIIDVNDAYTGHTGLEKENIIGKLATVAYDAVPPPYFDIYRDVVTSGRAKRFESFYWNMNRYFRISAFSTGMNKFVTIFEDVTEDKLMEIKLRNKTEELDRFFELTIDLLCIIGIDGHFKKLNPQWEKTLGYKIKDLEGKNIFDLIHPDDVEITRNAISDLTKNSMTSDFINRFRCKDGSYRWIEWRQVPFENLIYASARDITGRIRIEESLILSEARYKKLLESVTDFIYTVKIGKDDEISTAYGPGCLNVTGYSSEYFNNDRYLWFNIIYGEDKQTVVEHADNLLKGKSTGIEHRIVHKNGCIRWIRNTPVLRYDEKDRISGYDGLISDITATKIAEKALKESEDKFRTIFEYMTCAVAIYEVVGNGEDFIFKDINPAAEKTDRIDKKSVLGKSVKEIFPGAADLGIIAAFKRVFLTGKSEYFPDGICRDERNTGTWRENWVFKLPSGEIGSIYNDITERKKSQEKIQSSLVEKEALIRELYHRTKNNMQIISSMLMLSSSYTEDENVKLLFKDMENRILTMSIVHQKLYQSKDLSSVNLEDYIFELTQLLTRSYMIPTSKINLKMNIEKIQVLIDVAIPCGLIINEIISNALKYAFPDEKRGEITVSLKRIEDNHIELVISDNGIGVPEDFDFRSGSKMGMRIIYAVAELQLQGKVVFESKNGLSCRISFKEPVYDKRV
jgi:PAS domain S-box-containing protein